MTVTCQILFKRPKEGVHRAGHPVDGSIRYNIDKPGDFEQITLSLIGKGKCSWSQCTTTSQGTSSISYSGKEKYVVIHRPLLEKDGESLIVVTGGVHVHDFCFILPDNIPSSFKDNICTISYKVCIVFIRPGLLTRNIKFEAPIMVKGDIVPCSPEPIIFGLHKELTKPFSFKEHAVTLKAKVDKTFVTPGDNIKLALTINNGSDVNITAVKTELIRYTIYTSDIGKQKKHKKTIKEATEETPSIKKYSVTKISTMVPTLPELLSIQHSKIMSREYRVKVTVRLPLPHLNTSVEIPVVIANRFDSIDELKDKPTSGWDSMDEDVA